MKTLLAAAAVALLAASVSAQPAEPDLSDVPAVASAVWLPVVAGR